MRAPSPDTIVRLHLSPPANTVQAATAWRATVRPSAPARMAYAASLAVFVALLGVWVWSYHAAAGGMGE